MHNANLTRAFTCVTLFSAETVDERTGRTRFEFEATPAVGVGRRSRQHLDRHFAREFRPGVTRPIDLAHAARPKRREDLVRAKASARCERGRGHCPGDSSAQPMPSGWIVTAGRAWEPRTTGLVCRAAVSAIMDFDMRPHLSIDRHAVSAFCRRHHIARLALFGSVLRDDFGPNSDVDVLVEFQAGHVPGLAFISIERELSELLGGRTVDMVTPKFLNARIRDRVLRDAEPLYVAA